MSTDVKLPAACALLSDLAEVCLCNDTYAFIAHTLAAREKRMAYEMKEGQGTMFLKLGGNDKAPTFEGKLMMNGREVRFAAWKRVAKSGQLYYQLKVSDQGPRCQVIPPTDHDDVAPDYTDLPWLPRRL